MAKPVLPKLVMRAIVGLWVTSWVYLFWLFDHFSRTSPTHPDPSAGFTHYLKTVRNVVYLNDADQQLQIIATSVAVVSLLAFLSLGFFFRVAERPGAPK